MHRFVGRVTNSITSRKRDDDEDWDSVTLDRIHEEEHTRLPSHADREADMKARDEFALRAGLSLPYDMIDCISV